MNTWPHFVRSYHDTATVRDLFGLQPAPEFAAWLESHGIGRAGRLTTRDMLELLGSLDRLLPG